MRFQGGHVFRQIAPRQQTTMHFGMQGFDAAIQHFRKAGEFGDIHNGKTFQAQQFCRSTRGDQLDSQSMQAFGKFNNAGFVGDG